MTFLQRYPRSVLLIFVALLAVPLGAFTAVENQLPAFGRDTVLVYEIRSGDQSYSFVMRIAEFVPDRYVEWEDTKTQGTIFMPNKDVVDAKGFVTARLFESGVDTRGRNATTLWLSQRIYRDLKEKKKARLDIDSLQGMMKYQGDDQFTVEVNRIPTTLPVIRVMDDRGSERWFLDQEDNPLMVKHFIRHFTQALTSITTDRPNTLRWIKGKKLENPPH